MRRRVDRIFKGLLEVAPQWSLAEAKVHRTTEEFLEQESTMQNILTSTKLDFNANAVWCMPCIMQLKTSNPETLSTNSLGRDIRTCLEFTELASSEGYKRISALYDAMNNAAEYLASRKTASGSSLKIHYGSGTAPHWTTTHHNFLSSRHFLNFAVQCQLL